MRCFPSTATGIATATANGTPAGTARCAGAVGISVCSALACAACGMSAAAELLADAMLMLAEHKEVEVAGELLAHAYYDALDAETVQDGNATNEKIQNDD